MRCARGSSAGGRIAALRLVRGFAVAGGLAALALAARAAPVQPPCEGAERIRLREPVQLEAHERAALAALAPLRATAVSAPPLVRYDEQTGRYDGLALDVLCFLGQHTGVRLEMLAAREVSVADKIAQVQQGRLDLMMPLSDLPERARLGLFSLPFYESQYAAIAPRGRRLQLQGTADLARLRVGIVEGVAIAQPLRELVPAAQWRRYRQTVTEDGLFNALRRGEIDVALFNRDFFIEERYRHELFDLEVVHVLNEFTRSYRLYLHRTADNEAVVAAFNRFLAVMDTSASLQRHEDGERRLMDRYVRQRSQRTLILAASVAAMLLAVAAFVALRYYRRLVRQLADSTLHVMRQQEQLLAANRELQQLSQTDGLTRLANRRHFDHALEREHARWQRTAAPLSLLMIDLDHFKLVNDHYGHAVGDDYLRAVARTLEGAVGRATDMAARFGGEEFVCLLPETDTREAQLVAERIRAAVQALALPNAQAPIPLLTVSVGVATLAGGSHDALAALKAADEQLYAAKRAGRNRVQAAVLA